MLAIVRHEFEQHHENTKPQHHKLKQNNQRFSKKKKKPSKFTYLLRYMLIVTKYIFGIM